MGGESESDDQDPRVRPRSDGRILELRRVYPQPPPVVFAALSDPNQLRKWWGPAGFTVGSLRFPVRVGEAYRIEMHPPEGPAFHLGGEFREVEPPARLAYTFAWQEPHPDDVETLVRLSLSDVGTATEVALVQGAFKTEARWALHRDGWTDSFDKLERLLAAHA